MQRQIPDDFAFDEGGESSIYPAVYYGDGQIFQCNWFSKQWRQTKNFVKKHKKAIIVGAVIVVAVATIYGVALATSAAGAGTLATAAATGNNGTNHLGNDEPKPIPPIQIESPTSTFGAESNGVLRNILEEQTRSFRDYLSAESYFPIFEHQVPYKDFSLGEHGRVVGSMFTHESLKNFEIQIPNLLLPASAHQEVDQRFSTDYTPLFIKNDKEDFRTLLYQQLVEKKLLMLVYWI